MELLNHVAVLKYHRTGSSYTCNPPVLDTDEDWVVLSIPELRTNLNLHLMNNDYIYDDYESYARLHGTTQFTSWRSTLDGVRDQKGVNLIVTFNPEWYQLFVEATEIAKEENLLTKEERVACFEMIMRKYRKETPSRTVNLIKEVFPNWSKTLTHSLWTA